MSVSTMNVFAGALAVMGAFTPTVVAYGTLSPYVSAEPPVTQQISTAIVDGHTVVSYSVCTVVHQTDCAVSVVTGVSDYEHPPTVVPTIPGADSSFVSVHHSQPTAPGAPGAPSSAPGAPSSAHGTPPSAAGPEQPGNPTDGGHVSLPTQPGYSTPPAASQPGGSEPGVPPPPASQTAVPPPGVTASSGAPSGQQTLTGDYTGTSSHPTGGGTGTAVHTPSTSSGRIGHSGSGTATGTSLKPIVTGSTTVAGPEATATGAAVTLNAIPAMALCLAGMLVAYML